MFGSSYSIALVLFAAVSVVLALRSQFFSVKLTDQKWLSLVAKLESLDKDGVTTVALDFLSPQEGQIALEPSDIWNLVGGYTGLRKMRANATVMLALAAFVQQWNFDEAVIVSERMRRDALALRRSIRHLEFSSVYMVFTRTISTSMPFDVHEAAASYHLMRQRLLALYKANLSGMYPALAEAL